MISLKPQNLQFLFGIGDYADVFCEDTRYLTIRWEEGAVKEVNAGKDTGTGIRYLENDSVFFGHQNSLAVDHLQALAEKLSINLTKIKTPVPRGRHDFFTHNVKRKPSSVTLAEKMVFLKELHGRIKSVGDEIAQIIMVYAEKERDYLVVNSTGSSAGETRYYCTLMISVIAERKGMLQTATDVLGGVGGYELMDRTVAVIAGMQTARRALSKLSAPRAMVGKMPVVISSEAGGTMIHEAVGHSLEADAVQKGISPVYRGKKGTLVASPLITVVDDPTVTGKRGSYVFDDEGLPGVETVLIKDGVLQTYLYDVASARKDGIVSNAHGRRQSYRNSPIPRMSNTMILPGKDDPEDIIHSISDGLLVKRMGGGQVNTATGDFIFEVEEGYHVKDGAIKGLVRGANLLGNGPEVLKSIDRLGSDLGWGLGTCGKEGQGVPVSDAQPTLRIRELLVGGADYEKRGVQ